VYTLLTMIKTTRSAGKKDKEIICTKKLRKFEKIEKLLLYP
jgi:hypothetical protein